MIVRGDAEPQSFYPIVLTQLTTVAANPLNVAGYPSNAIYSTMDPSPVSVFRFYFDGLEFEFVRQQCPPIGLGASANALINLRTFEESQTRKARDKANEEARKTYAQKVIDGAYTLSRRLAARLLSKK
jgi:hypothetical protein